MNWEAPKNTSLEEQATLPVDTVRHQTWPPMEEQVTQQVPLQRPVSRKLPRWSILPLLAALLLAGTLIGHTLIANWLLASSSQNKTLEQLLHSHTQPIYSSALDAATQSFMDAMLHKDWRQMWALLSPDAQGQWRDEADFVHFEQAKFGALTLSAYKAGPALTQQPWLDPDTTQVYSSAATRNISLQASAPVGLLTLPSNQALQQGLFAHTLFALVQSNTTWKVLVAGPADPDAPTLVPATPASTRLLVPIFMYHHISNKPARTLLDYGLTVRTTDFDSQLSWLQERGYSSITMSELFDAFYDGKALPAHPMMLTFDDGYADAYTDALPTLLKHHLRGVFYIITGMIGGNYMTWNQVHILARSGMEIASHTIHHINIGQPPAGTSTQQELLGSKATLESQLGQPIQFFCYPTGEPFHHDTLYEQKIVLADLFNDGYVSATLDPFSYSSAIQNSALPYELPRIRVSGGESISAFMSILQTNLNIGKYEISQGGA